MKIVEFLNKFGLAHLRLKIDDFTKHEQILQEGIPAVRIDIITSIDSVNWDESIKN